MKRIRVCIFSFKAYPLFKPDFVQSNYGGAEVMSYLIASELARDPEFDVHLIVGDFGQPKTESFGNITLHRTFGIRQDFKYLRYPFAALALLRVCKQVNADIYFQSAAGIVTGLIAFYCRSNGSKFVYRTASDKDCNGEFIRRYQVAGLFYRYGLLKAHAIITQTKSHQLMLWRSIKLDSTVIHNGQPLRQQSNEVERKDILWVGRLVDCKRPLLFVELARSFPGERFVMIGSGERRYNRTVSTAAQALPNLHYIPHVSYSKIEQYFRRAKVLINTSTMEGFPNTFVQAVSNGTSVITLRVNPGGFLNKENIGYCAEGLFPNLKMYLRDFLDNPVLQKEYQQRAFDYAYKYHDLNVISEGYKALFRKVIR